MTGTTPTTFEPPAVSAGKSADMLPAVGSASASTWERRTVAVHLVLLAALAGLHASLIPISAVKWDEFRFLSDVYSFQRGDLASGFQTFHVHLFRWLPALGGNEVDQVVVARGAYFLLLLASCFLVYFIGTRFLSRAASLFAVVCYLAFVEVIEHGTAFRFDGLSVFFLLAAVAILLHDRNTWRPLVLAGGCAAIALLVTVKSVFYLPTLCMVVLLRRESVPLRVRLGNLVAFGACTVALFVVAFAVHMHGLAGATVGDTAGSIQRAGYRTLGMEVLFPARWFFVRALLYNAATWLLIVFGVVTLLRRLWTRDRPREAVLLLSFLLPLLSIVVYRNAFSYYYVFLMPAAVLVAAVRIDEILHRAWMSRSAVSAQFVAIAMFAVLLLAALNYGRYLRHETVLGGRVIQEQHQLVQGVHEVFPEPVPYIDAGSMIASFPKVGFFMSSWGFQNYQEAGVPIFDRLLREGRPAFLLANQSALAIDSDVGVERESFMPDRLLEEDVRFLRDNFVPHWGPIFVVGKRLHLSEDAEERIEIVVPGPYTVETRAAIAVNDDSVQPGGALRLERGIHRLRSLSGSQAVVVRWGTNLGRPAFDAPEFREQRRARPIMRPIEDR